MKRISLSLATILLLTACSGGQTVVYRLDFKNAGAHQLEGLTAASMEVIERRLAHLEVELLEKKTETRNDQTFLSVTLPSKEAGDALTAELVKPFDLTVMGETEPHETADITIEDRGSFTKTDITQDDFTWVDARKDPTNGMGEVRLILTDDGRTKINALFARLKGKSIGIFVRDRLVSLLKVQTDAVPDNLIIRDVPSVDIAGIFADDMNVGLHVTFTPVP